MRQGGAGRAFIEAHNLIIRTRVMYTLYEHLGRSFHPLVRLSVSVAANRGENWTSITTLQTTFELSLGSNSG